MAKTRVIIRQSINVFTMYRTFFPKRHKNFTYNLPKQNWNAVKKQEVPGLIIRSGKLYQPYKSHLSIMFGGTV